MTAMDWRVRLLGRLLRRTSVTRMTPDAVVAAPRPVARNALTDRMMGAPSRGSRAATG